jgi:hypothetical protein
LIEVASCEAAIDRHRENIVDRLGIMEKNTVQGTGAPSTLDRQRAGRALKKRTVLCCSSSFSLFLFSDDA